MTYVYLILGALALMALLLGARSVLFKPKRNTGVAATSVINSSRTHPPGAGEIRAWGVLVLTGLPLDGERVICGDLGGFWPGGVIRGWDWKDTVSTANLHCQIGADVSACVTNARAFCTSYSAAGAFSHSSPAAGVLKITAGVGYTGVSGNTIPVSESCTNQSWKHVSGGKLSGGVDDDASSAPSTGDKYLLGLSTATNDSANYATSYNGAWEFHDGEIATWNGSAWVFTSPVNGDRVLDTASGITYAFSGTTWTAV